jgi:hypothetical protein
MDLHQAEFHFHLVITYQDLIGVNGVGVSYYQLRVDDQPSVAGPNGALLACNTFASGIATGVWTGLSQGNHTLSIWHRVEIPNGSGCVQNWGPNTTSVIVMEIES